jgi:hypothetical protein
MRRLVVLLCACAKAAAPAAPKASLVDPGAEPRRVIKLAAKGDETRHYEGTAQLSFTRDVKATFAASATIRPTGQGGVVETFKVTDIGGDMLVKVLAGSAVGATATLTMDANGRMTDVDANIPGPLGQKIMPEIPKVKKALVDGDVHFPDEPIGIGAHWTAQAGSTKADYRLTGDHELTMDLVGKSMTVHAVQTFDDELLTLGLTAHAEGSTSKDHPFKGDLAIKSVSAPASSSSP